MTPTGCGKAWHWWRKTHPPTTTSSTTSSWPGPGTTRAIPSRTPTSNVPTGGHRLCRDETVGAEPTREVFTDVAHDQDLLVDMLVNDIDPGPDLVHVEKVETAHEGVRAVLLTAYRSPAEDTLVITVEFNTVDDVGLDLFGASYTTDTGWRSTRTLRSAATNSTPRPPPEPRSPFLPPNREASCTWAAACRNAHPLSTSHFR